MSARRARPSAMRRLRRKLAAWSAGFARPGITICIPTFNAQPFVRTALRCALGQTYKHVKVAVSVDKSDDRTAALCLEMAKTDSRLTVYEQPQRLGWAGNCNFLLDRVTTEYFCLYFHDDILLPQYCETLLAALARKPGAVCAYCDVGQLGDDSRIVGGRNFTGPAAKRLAAYLVAPSRGMPVRGLTKTSAAGHVRLPTGAAQGLWANEVYMLQLLACGAAIHVPETLYFHGNRRKGGLTDGWKSLPIEMLYAGRSYNLQASLQLFEDTAMSPQEREVLRYCLYVSAMTQVRSSEKQRGVRRPVLPETLHPAFADLRMPERSGVLDRELYEWIVQKRERLQQLETEWSASPADED
jgi:hypothetical protein